MPEHVGERGRAVQGHLSALVELAFEAVEPIPRMLVETGVEDAGDAIAVVAFDDRREDLADHAAPDEAVEGGRLPDQSSTRDEAQDVRKEQGAVGEQRAHVG